MISLKSASTYCPKSSIRVVASHHLRKGCITGPLSNLTSRDSSSSSMAFRQPTHRPEIQSCLQWMRKNASYSVIHPDTEERRAFVPLNTIRTHFEELSNTTLSDLLKALFDPAESPVDADDILQNRVQVFCTLLMIGKGEYIEQFTSSWGLSDSRLPFRRESPPEDFPVDPADPDFFQKFCNQQWMFCAPEFQSPMRNMKFEEERILPIVHKRQIAGGGSGMLYEIRLHGSYNKLDPKVTVNIFRSHELSGSF